jgi:Type I site-specific restriction-modification system, R (restriction) subunit and related helicases
VTHYNTIAEANHFIVLSQYEKVGQVAESYQSEDALERELIQDLVNQGYEFVPELTHPDAMLANVRVQLQTLNNVTFSEAEWQRFVETYLDKAKRQHCRENP